MKTIKQLSDEIGISKQKLYRHIKKHCINDAHHEAGMMWFDDVAETVIKEHFIGSKQINDAHHEAHQTASNDAVLDTLVAMLQRELDTKNKQIADLSTALEHTTASLHAAQALHAGTMQKQLTDGSQGETEETRQPVKKRFWERFRKGD